MLDLAPDTIYYFGSNYVIPRWNWQLQTSSLDTQGLNNVQQSKPFLLREAIDHNFWGAKADLLARNSLAVKQHNRKLTLKGLISGRAQASLLSVKPWFTTKAKKFVPHLCAQAWCLPCLQTPPTECQFPICQFLWFFIIEILIWIVVKLVTLVVWKRVAPISLYMWMLSHCGVPLLGKIRKYGLDGVGVILLEEVFHWGWALGFQTPSRAWCFFFSCFLWIKMNS